MAKADAEITRSRLPASRCRAVVLQTPRLFIGVASSRPMHHSCPLCKTHCDCKVWSDRGDRMQRICVHCASFNDCGPREHDEVNARNAHMGRQLVADLLCQELDKAETLAHPDRFAAAARETAAAIVKAKGK